MWLRWNVHIIECEYAVTMMKWTMIKCYYDEMCLYLNVSMLICDYAMYKVILMESILNGWFFPLKQTSSHLNKLPDWSRLN